MQQSCTLHSALIYTFDFNLFLYLKSNILNTIFCKRSWGYCSVADIVLFHQLCVSSLIIWNALSQKCVLICSFLLYSRSSSAFFSLETVLERVIVVAPSSKTCFIGAAQLKGPLSFEERSARSARCLKNQTTPYSSTHGPRSLVSCMSQLLKKRRTQIIKSAKFSRPYSLGEQCHPSRTRFTLDPTTPKISFLQN